MGIIFAVVVICVYMVCPLIGKVVLLISNTFLPDPIPFVDEIIMWIGLMMHLARLQMMFEFIGRHKKAFLAILLIIIAVILCFCNSNHG